MKTHDTLDREYTPSPSAAEQWHKVGNSALAYYGEIAKDQPPKSQGFDHLFSYSQLGEERIAAVKTSEDAINLAKTLEPDDPYRDYALSEISLRFIKDKDLKRAYELLGDITDPGVAIHVLSELVIFEDDNNTGTIELNTLGQELHDRAIHAYDEAPTTERARAICEASEALPTDKELRLFARIAMAEHPEILPPQEPDDML